MSTAHNARRMVRRSSGSVISSCRRNSAQARRGYRRNSGSVRRQHSIVRRTAMNPPANGKSGDRHAGTRSHGWRCPEGPGEVPHSKRPIIIRRPVLAQCLGRSTAFQPLAPSLEPAPDSDVVVRSGEIADHEGKEMKTARQRVGRGAAA